MKTSPIAVLGAGAWGASLAMLLARNGQSVRLWDLSTELLTKLEKSRMHMGVTLPANLKIEFDLNKAVADLQDICLVIPSYAFHSLLTTLKPIVRSDVRFVWGTKGLEPKTCAFLHTVVAEVFSDKTPAAVISGPSFAKEVADNLPTAVSVASNDKAFTKDLIARFNSNCFRVYESPDMIGVQLCGVVKNVMAIAVGISDGLGFKANTRCALITRGLFELGRLCEALGGQQETVLSLAGVGDLILTSTDNQSRNRRFGLAMGEGKTAEQALKDIGESVEGYYNVKQLHQLALKAGVEMPVAQHVYEIIYENCSAKSVVDALGA